MATAPIPDGYLIDKGTGMGSYLYPWTSKWARIDPDGYSGYGNVPCLPVSVTVGEPDYLSCHANIRPKEAQHRYFVCSRNPSLIFSHHLCQQHKHACFTSARAPRFLSSVSLSPLLVLFATSLFLLDISETPTFIPG